MITILTYNQHSILITKTTISSQFDYAMLLISKRDSIRIQHRAAFCLRYARLVVQQGVVDAKQPTCYSEGTGF